MDVKIVRTSNPGDVIIKETTIKEELTGEWFAYFTVDSKGAPQKPEEPERYVGIDVGILKYTHDADGTAVESPDLSTERSGWNTPG